MLSKSNNMVKYRGKYRIKSNRCANWDYNSNGRYFVTVNTHNRECHFGTVINKRMELNQIGNFVFRCWMEIPLHHENVNIGAFCIMPNHIHGIIILHEREAIGWRPNLKNSVSPFPVNDFDYFKTISPSKGSLGVIIRSFKSAVTKYTHEQNPKYGFAWQRGYYDHVIRNDKSYDKIVKYIKFNPVNWRH